MLPTALSDQIAAGEVIERPASVVKELVENALDAGASRIDVDVDGGGVASIRVADNGSGMSEEDAKLAVLRHATSKIATAADLTSISTLGFRGEALPSIGAVSRLRIITRTGGSPQGTEVRVAGGAPAEVAPAAGAVGTVVEVSDLFYNTPARRKFMRGEVSERRAVVDVMTRAALVRPDAGFSLRFDGREVISAPAVADAPGLQPERVSQLLGARIASGLFPLNADVDGFRVSGLLGRPHEARARADRVYLFVAGRPVRDRRLQQAILLGYRGALEKGRFPVAVVALELPLEQVDVNVHPQKHEVRFENARGVFDGLRRAVEGEVARAPWSRSHDAAAAAAPRRSTADAFALLPPEPAQESLPLRPRPMVAEVAEGRFPQQGSPAAEHGDDAGGRVSSQRCAGWVRCDVPTWFVKARRGSFSWISTPLTSGCCSKTSAPNGRFARCRCSSCWFRLSWSWNPSSPPSPTPLHRCWGSWVWKWSTSAGRRGL